MINPRRKLICHSCTDQTMIIKPLLKNSWSKFCNLDIQAERLNKFLRIQIDSPARSSFKNLWHVDTFCPSYIQLGK